MLQTLSLLVPFGNVNKLYSLRSSKSLFLFMLMLVYIDHNKHYKLLKTLLFWWNSLSSTLGSAVIVSFSNGHVIEVESIIRVDFVQQNLTFYLYSIHWCKWKLHQGFQTAHCMPIYLPSLTQCNFSDILKDSITSLENHRNWCQWLIDLLEINPYAKGISRRQVPYTSSRFLWQEMNPYAKGISLSQVHM